MIRKPCRAARALQTAHSDWLELASIDGELHRMIAGWVVLPKSIRSAMLALIGAIDATE